MPTRQERIEQVSQLVESTTQSLCGSWANWTQFLTTASRLYKYPYEEQVMIYAQRPDAAACASYEIWNERMHRYILRGSRGIALVGERGSQQELRYVFDVSDTGTRQRSRSPWQWQLEERYELPVQEVLSREYELSDSPLPRQLGEIATQLAENAWETYGHDVLESLDGSLLEGYDEENVELRYRAAATVSIHYVLLTRCGCDPEEWMDREDARVFTEFTTPQLLRTLGKGVSENSEYVLRQMETAIRAVRAYEQSQTRQHERSANNGRTDLPAGGRLFDSQPGAGRAAHQAAEQVRENAVRVHQEAQTGPVQRTLFDSEAQSTLPGDRGRSSGETGRNDAPSHESSRSHRGAETGRSHEVGGLGEQLQGSGGGSHSGRAGVQLTEAPPAVEQLSLFPGEQEQIRRIDQAEYAQASSAFSISQGDLDHVLRLGGNTERQRERVAAAFEK